MTHEKIFKREDGTRYKIWVKLEVDTYRVFPYWVFWVHKCEPRKRLFGSVIPHDYRYPIDYSSNESVYLQHVTPEEVLETKLELWNLIKPE